MARTRDRVSSRLQLRAVRIASDPVVGSATVESQPAVVMGGVSAVPRRLKACCCMDEEDTDRDLPL